MISFDHDPVVTDSLTHWQRRRPMPTALKSVDLRRLGSEIHLRSVFSAQTTSLNYLEYVAEVIDDVLAGRIGMAEARLRLMRKLAELGYDPATGFPEDFGKMTPAERGSLQDLSSAPRIDLLLKTNVAIARNYGRVLEGNTDAARYMFPAWELVRLGWREVERGSAKSHTSGWPRRWAEAGESVGWVGALGGSDASSLAERSGGGAASTMMIALKDSPIWQALGDGAGGDYSDTLGHPFPPFAFNSGMDWRAVPRAECAQRGLLHGDAKPAPMQAGLAPTAEELNARFDRLAPDLRAVLEARWAA